MEETADRRDDLMQVGEAIDRLITLDVKRASVSDLNEAARAQHGRPPTLEAGYRLVDTVGPLDVVIIITGALVSPFGTGETDGPIGAAGLARALALEFQARPLVLTMPSMEEMVRGTVRAAGLNVIDPEDLHGVEEWMRGFVAVGTFPVDDAEARNEADHLIQDFDPVAVISVETTGPNAKGVYHNYGRDFSPYIMKAGRLFDSAGDAGILTVGIGDRGNEIGFGAPGLHEAARKTHPYGAVCRCPCGEGAADVTPVDVTVVATVSNWGAYGIEAALSAVSGREDALHSGEIEDRMIEACSRLGGVDGRYQTPEYLVDSMDSVIHAGVVEMLRAVVRAKVEFGSWETHDPYGKGKY